MKKAIYTTIFTILCFLFILNCNANEQYTDKWKTIEYQINSNDIIINGNSLSQKSVDNIKPINKNNQILLPANFIIDEMDGKLNYDNSKSEITITLNNIETKINTKSKKYSVNNQEKNFDFPIDIIENRVYLPINFINDVLKLNIDANSERIVVTGRIQQNNTADNIENINIKVGNKTFNAKLYDNNATKEFIKKLPLTINMSDLHSNEKYFYMDTSLPTESETPTKINKGDIMLYGNNCIVLFYDTFSNSYNYTKLGYIENSDELKSTLGNGDVKVTFEIN